VGYCGAFGEGGEIVIPWWGWLIISLAGLSVLYFLVVVVFQVVVLKFLKDWME
jgi:hypothetical protein